MKPENLLKYINDWRIDIQLSYYNNLLDISKDFEDYNIINPLVIYAQTNSKTKYTSWTQLTDAQMNIGRYGGVMFGDSVISYTAHATLEEMKGGIMGFESGIDIYDLYLENGWDNHWSLIKSKGKI